MIFFSIIIPVYNVEKYLEKCIESVLEQQYTNFEVILVNDGSTDRSGKICDIYSKKDARIKVIHKANGGSSDARNKGIELSEGEYLLFLDSDDYWEGIDALKNISKKISENKNIDVLLHGCMDYNFRTGEKKISRTGYNNQLIEKRPKSEVLKYLFESNLFPGSAWITVTKRSFIVENGLYFVKGIKSEDIDWLLKVFLKANNFEATNDYFYIYLKGRNDSITGTVNIKTVEDLLFIIEKWSEEIKAKEYCYISEHVENYLAYQLCTAMISYNYLTAENKQQVKRRILNSAYLFKKPLTSKMKMASLIYRICGLEMSSKIFAYINRAKNK